MTYEELKAEAKRQGYQLSKIKKHVPHVRCVCCGKRGELWHCPDGDFIMCSGLSCIAQSKPAPSERRAWINWYELNVGEWEE